MKTLEQYFRDNNQAIDHSIRVQVRNDLVTFYIHPQGVNGDTLDFSIEDNSLIPITSGGHIYKKELNIEKEDDISCYCEYVKKYYPNDVLIHIPKDKKIEIMKLIRDYLINSKS